MTSPFLKPMGIGRILLGLALAGLVLSACGPKPTPGEVDRQRGEEAVDQLPK